MNAALALSIASMVFIGTGEVVSSRLVRTIRPEALTAAYFAVGVALAPLLLVVVGGAWDSGDFFLGAASGLFNGFGLLLAYRSFLYLPIGVTIPIVAVIGSMVPVLYGVVVGGESLTGFVLLGVALGVVSVVLVSLDPQPMDEWRRGLALSISAGMCFGILPIWLSYTSTKSGMWPMLPQRTVAFAVAATIAFRKWSAVFPLPGRRLPAMGAGILSAGGVATYLLAVQRGDLSLVSVTSAQYPAVALGLSYLLFRTSTRWWQTLGFCCSAAAVALIVLG